MIYKERLTELNMGSLAKGHENHPQICEGCKQGRRVIVYRDTQKYMVTRE